MKKSLALLLVLVSLTIFAQKPLSENAQISVLTLGPYQSELYSAFGHSAIRVYDPASGSDLAFNYGVFDFDQPNFYLNFTRGHLLYKLGVYPYDLFRDHYISHNRYVHEQVLNLTQAQKQKVFDYLFWNAQPENVDYLYDYFYNNCATKVRDVFVEVFADSIKFDATYAPGGYTVRDLTHSYLSQQPWGELGIEICLGQPMDKTLTTYEYMFIPDYIESGFNRATLNGKPIVRENVSVYESKPEAASFSIFRPWIVFGLFLVIVIALTIRDWRRKRLAKWFDVVLFSVMGWLGLLLFILWVATDHHAAAKNWNLLWAFPLHAIAGPMLVKSRFSGLVKKYFLATALVLVATLVLWAFLPQQLNVFLIPLVVAMAIRAYSIHKLV
ncbi:MAG TPA: DUF4105 domain-containing protein [Cyclobacteriaceae bacterium]|nr:DUF4105 domain-containing protein [Cyclobacteriaceae bacterium]HMV08275.1 DUF4105 domain-containing protein [Cyclobacteriaceae bacterium]HMV90279.1 DUF4105 domain-containing protein [Cyclobacteriaceae bacterium]HMX02118.1 DUF4105 domain-containing protein [Cyclobacteriaceae bacterium]HMX49906.1 DUF4105 domain-containing protein [Cyclobacteriaceae bacterium]